jgi:hypothetical protein
VSVAPVSYFFCASAPPVDAANIANAVEAIAKRVATKSINVSPSIIADCVVAAFFSESSFDVRHR